MPDGVAFAVIQKNFESRVGWPGKLRSEGVKRSSTNDQWALLNADEAAKLFRATRRQRPMATALWRSRWGADES